MDAPPPLAPVTPPPEEKPPSFKLSWGAWVALGLYAALRVTLFFLRPGPASAYAEGELFGELAAMFLLPTALALLAWRLAGRSATAGNATFFVVFALAVMGQFARFSQRAQASAEMQRIAAEQKRATDQGRPLDEKERVKLAERMSEQLGKMAENSDGHQRDLAAASKGYMDQMLATKRRYDEAVANLGGDDFWDLAQHAEAATIAARRKAVRAFAQANTQLSAFQDENGTAFRRELVAHGVSESDIAAAIGGYKKSAGPRLALMTKIRETDGQIAQAMLDFLDFADANRGKWRKNETDGKIIFDAPDAAATYREILTRVNQASDAQAEYQKQVLAPKN